MTYAVATMERQRHLEGLRDDLRSGVRSMREVQVRVGRTLLDIQRSRNLLLLGSTTFPIFCEQEGLSPVEARELTAMAEAAETAPDIAARVTETKLTPQKAALIHEVMKTPEIQRPGEDLLAFAETKSAKDLIREVKKRRADAELGEPSVCMVLQVSGTVRDDFRRCQTLVSRSLGRLASDGEALERITDDYLERHDPERKARRLEGKRLGCQTPVVCAGGSASPQRRPRGQPVSDTGVRSRHVPAVDSRELLRAAGDRCWVDGCGNEAFLQMAHRRAFRVNGANRARNLLRLCRTHHGQLDSGVWWLAFRRDGQVVLMDRRGVRVGRLRDEAAAFVSGVRHRLSAPGIT